MSDRCDFEFRMCRESSLLKKLYDGHVRSINKNFLEAVEEFEDIAERSVRPRFSRILADAGRNQRNID
jgi:hypothetical protein